MVHAKIIWDGKKFEIPEESGKPREDQLTSTNLDNLVELAGRTCYNSCGTGRNSIDYHKHIIEVNHGCYDVNTEVLTSVGWIRWPEVTKKHLFATLRKDGIIEYHHPENIISYPYKGKMYRVNGRGLDLLVTPNHRMYVCPTTTKEGRKRTDFTFITAEVIDNKSHAYTKIGNWQPAIVDNIPNDVAALLGFAIGDGNISAHSRYLFFHLHRQRKILWLKDVCERLKWEVTVNDDRYRVIIPEQYLYLFTSIYDENDEKIIPNDVIVRWSKETLESLFVGLMQSDGHQPKSNTSDSYYTTSKTLAGQIQQLCLHIGLAANYCYTVTDRSKSFGNKPLIVLTIITKDLKPQVNKWSGTKRKTYWIDSWEGEVFCASVPNNTLYVRRNGQPVWCGNSVWEHSNLCFHTEGMSVPDYLACCETLLNRPGIFVAKRINDILTIDSNSVDMRLTCNLRAIREWHRYPPANIWGEVLGNKLQFLAKKFAPLALCDIEGKDTKIPFVVAEPVLNDEIWISIFFTNVSRGLSHEIVRHGNSTAISQRSTRYVDESDSPWVYHPLVNKWLASLDVETKKYIEQEQIGVVEGGAKQLYKSLVDHLQRYLIAQGADKFTARKQARGAARGFLGNALMTELVFSASLAQWQHMILMRANGAADGEIRIVFNEVFDLLKEHFPKQFEGWTKHQCSDGLGDEIRATTKE